MSTLRISDEKAKYLIKTFVILAALYHPLNRTVMSFVIMKWQKLLARLTLPRRPRAIYHSSQSDQAWWGRCSGAVPLLDRPHLRGLQGRPGCSSKLLPPWNLKKNWSGTSAPDNSISTVETSLHPLWKLSTFHIKHWSACHTHLLVLREITSVFSQRENCYFYSICIQKAILPSYFTETTQGWKTRSVAAYKHLAALKGLVWEYCHVKASWY